MTSRVPPGDRRRAVGWARRNRSRSRACGCHVFTGQNTSGSTQHPASLILLAKATDKEAPHDQHH